MLAAPGRVDNPRAPVPEPRAVRTGARACSVGRRPAREHFGPE
jgi:hypothetical protein